MMKEKKPIKFVDSVTQLPTRCRQTSRVNQQRKPTVDRGWMIEAIKFATSRC